jgi:hypothetical protein
MPSDDQPPGNGRSLPQARLAQDFSIVLMRTIESMKSDPSQFRNMIYEMARMRLQKEAFLRDPPMNVLEQRRLMLALETAIERVETESFVRDSLPLLAAEMDPDADLFEPLPSVADLDAAPTTPLEREPTAPVIDSDPAPASAVAPAPRRAVLPAAVKAVLRLGALATVAAAIVLVANHEFHLDGNRLLATVQNVLPQAPARSRRRTAVPQTAEVASIAAPAEPSTASAVIAPPPQADLASQPAYPPQTTPSPPRSALVPAAYGVYAVSDGKLFELEPLMGRVPDPRIFMSAVITKPSRTLLPDGRVTFIVYRREVATSAPDHVTVRVIAKVVRDLKFGTSGHATTAKVDDAWAIRNVSFDYRVAPSPDNREMIVVKPENDAFMLSPGRYGLVVNGLAYDFAVDGWMNEPSHCLERTEAANGTFYTECRAL